MQFPLCVGVMAKSDVHIQYIDNVHVKLICDLGILKEIQERFTFEPPDAKHRKRMMEKKTGRRSNWDGKIRLLNGATKKIYRGLLNQVIEFCKDAGYSVTVDAVLLETEEITTEQVEKLYENFKVPDKAARDYQVEATRHCIEQKRGLLLSPTASGKSFIIYSLIRHYSGRALIVVPTTQLCIQMAGDFEEYSKNDTSWDVNQEVSIIMSGRDKINLKPTTVSTWQSIYNMSPAWLSQFDVIIVDEAHGAQANSLKGLLEKATCEHRFGFTGTTDGTDMNEMVLEGLFGPPRKVVDTATLIKNKHVADIMITPIIFEYAPKTKKLLSGDYREELNFIVQHQQRNEFICKLASKLEGNTLILFQLVEKHGETIYKMLNEMGVPNLHFISGATDPEIRDEIRKKIDSSTNNIIVASVQTTGTGTNMVNLNNLILASPTKSKIRTLQSVGRGLRRSETKQHLNLFDLADDLCRSKTIKNHTYRHFLERLKMYITEGFQYDIKKFKLED